MRVRALAGGFAAVGDVVSETGGAPFDVVASPPIALAGSLGVAGDVAVASAQSDWASRIAGPDVVWYHGFDTAAEVDQFRWTGGYSGGNDPAGNGSGAGFLTHVASGGPDGGGFLRSQYPAGETAGRGNSYWWRPFNPLTGATNGRGSNDPGAGTLTPIAFNASDGSSTTYTWSLNASNPGWYDSAADQAASPDDYQGGDFYLQIRVRRAQTPGAPPDTEFYSSITGKNVWLTTTASSFVAQELVTYGQSVGNGDTVGVYSRHNVYVGQNFTSLDGQPNGTVAVENISLNWRYSGGWDTLLYHVTPGTNGGTGANRTRVEVWAQHDPTLFPEESGVYVKIWDVTYTQGYSTGTNSSGAPLIPGWNALILGSYHNGSAFASSFNFDYGQIIFSKATIPAPGASLSLEALSPIATTGSLGISCNLVISDGSASALETLATSMSSGTWAALSTSNINPTFLRGSVTGNTIPYQNNGVWDPVHSLVHVLGQDHGGGGIYHMTYTESTNAWSDTDRFSNYGEVGGHGYDHVEIDKTTGDLFFWAYFYGTNGAIYRWPYGGPWNLSYATRDFHTNVASGVCVWTGTLSGFSDPKGVLCAIDGDFGEIRGKGISDLANTGIGFTLFADVDLTSPGYHLVAAYNPISNVAVFGGGNNQPRRLWKMTSTGTVTELTLAPSGCNMGIQQGGLFENPSNGNFLIMSGGQLWELNPAGSGTYTQLTGSHVPPSGVNTYDSTSNSVVAIPISTYGVLMVISADAGSSASCHLYKP